MTTDILCAKCLKSLQAGRGEFYLITIDAVADPTPPTFAEGELAHDLRPDWRAIVAELEDVSSQEALDQVYRRVVIHLCNACFRRWIENPAE
jgi:hypothetical protein